MKKIFSLIIILGLSLLPVMLFAASETGPIAVLDFIFPKLSLPPPYLNTEIPILDNTDEKVEGTLKVFQNHTTPLRPDGSLDLAKIRAGTPSPVCTRPATATLPAYPACNIELHRRGSSSLSYPKKNYSLDFKDDVSFLNMPTEKEWVLHSCWADKTCLRNVIGYWQAARLFPWAPRTEFAEVFINGYYRGLYVVVEKVKLGDYRVNLPTPTDDLLWWESEGPPVAPVIRWRPAGISGAYILKRDGDDFDPNICDPRDFSTECTHWQSTVYPDLRWWFVSPKKHLTQWQKNYIHEHMDVDFEPSFHPAYAKYDPRQYNKWIDERSAADFVIIQEIANNADAYWKSMHITKQRASWSMPFNPGLIHMGPIWDLDQAFANTEAANRRMCQTDGWRMETVEETGGAFRPLTAIWKVPQFRRAIYDRWRALRDDRGHGPENATVSPERIAAKIKAFAARIEDARIRDNVKWDTLGKKTWAECWNMPGPNSMKMYQDEVAALVQWIGARIEWMDKKISESHFLNP